MIKVKQHIPDYCEGFTRETVVAATTVEMLKTELFQRFSDSPMFTCFELADRNSVIAVYQEGLQWWVVGFVIEGTLELPRWRGWLFKGTDGQLYSKEVASVCGDTMTLKDGRKVEIARAPRS